MPQVQFARADLPWLFTPAAPGTDEDAAAAVAGARHGPPQDGVRLAPHPGGPLPVLELDATRPAELPDLAQSWAWAHAQIAGLGAGARPADVLGRRPGPGVLAARLRRARSSPTPRTWPAWCRRSPAGVKAGLGEPVTATDEADARAGLEPDARRPAAAAGLPRLGVRHRPRGKLRDAGAALHPSPLDPASARPPKLDLQRGRQRPAGRRRDRRAERAARARPGRAAAVAGRGADAVPDRARAACSGRAPGRPRAAGLRAAAGRRERRSRRRTASRPGCASSTSTRGCASPPRPARASCRSARSS